MSDDNGDDKSFGRAIAIGGGILLLLLLAAAFALFGVRLSF
jgi:hypothetical protein